MTARALSAPDEAAAASVAVVGAGPAAAACRSTLLAAGVPVTLLRDPAEVLGRVQSGAPAPAAAALDLVSLGRAGLDVLGELRAAWDQARIVAIAGSGAMTLARSAMRAGAFDFVAWPDQSAALEAVLRNAMTAAPSARADDMLRAAELIDGDSPVARDLRKDALGLAASKATVLIKGERGVGKRRLAALMHRLSDRGGELRRVDFSETGPDGAAQLIDAQAEALASGALAGPSTLVLERVCALPAGMQSRALRLIDAAAAVPDVRVLCTARDDLDAAAEDGRFRENVYHRLSVCVLASAPLRTRGRDVLTLARRGFARQAPDFVSLHPEVALAFLRHPWPENLRQLDRTVAWMAKRLERGVAVPSALPPEFLDTIDAPRPRARRRAEAPALAAAADVPVADPSLPLPARIAPLVGERLADVESALIDATLLRCGGSAEAAARLLGVSPATIYRRKAALRRTAAACNAARSERP